MVAKEDPRSFDLQILKKQLAGGKSVTLSVVTDSMEPLIKVGEKIDIRRPQSPIEYQVFDVILFDQGGRLNVHFLAKSDHVNQVYITQCLKRPGQNDFPLKEEQILGLVTNKKLSLLQKLKVLLVS